MKEFQIFSLKNQLKMIKEFFLFWSRIKLYKIFKPDSNKILTFKSHEDLKQFEKDNLCENSPDKIHTFYLDHLSSKYLYCECRFCDLKVRYKKITDEEFSIDEDDCW